MFASLVAGTAFMWFFGLLFVIALFASVSRESSLGATATVIVTGFLAYWLWDVNVITWVRDNFFTFLLYIIGYVALGIGWAVAKWLFLGSASDRAFTAWRTDNLSLKKEEFSSVYGKTYPLLLREHKANFTLWMTYWPISFVWTMIDDPIHRLFAWIYDSLANGLQKMSDTRSSKVYK